MTTLKIVDCEFEEIEEVYISSTLFETLSMINQATEIFCGTDRLRFEKTEYLAIDFMNQEIEIQVKFE